jgi:hypothetical protein
MPAGEANTRRRDTAVPQVRVRSLDDNLGFIALSRSPDAGFFHGAGFVHDPGLSLARVFVLRRVCRWPVVRDFMTNPGNPPPPVE